MSSRQMKRILRAKEEEERRAREARIAEEGEEEEEDEGIQGQSRGGFGFGAMYMSSSEEEEEEEEEVEAEDDADKTEAVAAAQTESDKTAAVEEEQVKPVETKDAHGDEAPANTTSMKSSKKSKKKKKKKKKKKNTKKNGKKNQKDDAVDDDDEALLEALAASKLEQAASTSATATTGPIDSRRRPPVLVCERPQYLNEDHEMRSKFGADTLRAERREQHRGDAARARGRGGGRRRMGRGKRQAQRKQRRKKWLLAGAQAQNWPMPPTLVSGGLGMEAVPGDAHTPRRFRFTVSREYARAEREFAVCQQTYDPNALMQFYQLHPHHAGTLLALGEFFSQVGRFDDAAALIRHGLHVFEAAWHPSFDPSSDKLGACRLRFAEDDPDTRSVHAGFFRTLFRSMQIAGRKGCTRTAMELAKLLVGMDPEADPMGGLLCLDYFALRAREYAYVLQLLGGAGAGTGAGAGAGAGVGAAASSSSSSDPAPEPLTIAGLPMESLPNLCFAKALALRGLGERARACRALQEALLTFPSALGRLAETCGWDQQPEWQPVLRSRLFRSSSAAATETAYGTSDVLPRLLSIFTTRQHPLWKPDATAAWMREQAAAAADLAGRDPAVANAFALRRAEAYARGTPLERYNRHSHQDFSDEVARLPPEMAAHLQGGGGGGGAGAGAAGGGRVPAAVMQQIQAQQAAAAAAAAAAAPNLGAEEMAAMNPLALFLRTMLPFVRPEDAAQAAEGEGGEEEG